MIIMSRVKYFAIQHYSQIRMSHINTINETNCMHTTKWSRYFVSSSSHEHERLISIMYSHAKRNWWQNGRSKLLCHSQIKRHKDSHSTPISLATQRKRDIKPGTIEKYKYCLNIDGSCMKQGAHYDQYYAPVASWSSINMLLIMTSVHDCHKKN